MRSRNLKPSFFLNYELAQVTPLGRILFEGLWCMADRKGRLEDIPQKIKVCILPYDSCDIQMMLDGLHKRDFILRYQIKGKRYIQIINFTKHQYPHIKESESTIPEPGKHHTRTVLKRLNPESPILNPESPIPIPPAAPDFMKVWNLYPRRKGRKAAERHFKASVKTEVELQAILHALENYKRSKEVVDGFIQNGSTWFNDWQSWVDIENAPNKSVSHRYVENKPREEDIFDPSEKDKELERQKEMMS